ncbi:hypothetical protein Q8A73_009345 [Channa argus]|nr:hypothetical protein Q8A73_009345 [Channa argus]
MAHSTACSHVSVRRVLSWGRSSLSSSSPLINPESPVHTVSPADSGVCGQTRRPSVLCPLSSVLPFIKQRSHILTARARFQFKLKTGFHQRNFSFEPGTFQGAATEDQGLVQAQATPSVGSCLNYSHSSAVVYLPET